MSSLPQIEKRELIELAQFVINRRTENLRDELHEYLVEIGLHDIDQSVSKAQITDLIKEKFNFSDFPTQIVDSALLRLQKKNELLVEVEGFISKFKLRPKRKRELHEMIEHHKSLRSYFIRTIIDRTESKLGSLSDFDKKAITKSLFDFLGRSFNVLSVKFATIMTKTPYEPKELDELLSETEILEKSFSRISEKNLRKVAIDVIQGTLREADERISLFLYSISQSFVLLQILNVDPECQALQKKLFLSNMTIYFDTNIIIDLLCERSMRRFHSTAVKLTDLMRSLGIKMCFTNRTFKELGRRIALSEENMRQIRPKRKKLKKILEYIDDPFLGEYYEQRKEILSLRWKGFIGRMRNFTSLLKRKYGITFDKSDYATVLADPRLLEISKMVSEADPKKTESLVEHDCFHLLLMEMLRSLVGEEDVIPKYWFVTRDKTVCLAERMRLIIEKKKTGIEKKPSSVLNDVWIHMVSPFLSPKIATQEASKAFAEMFSTHFIPSFPRMKPKVLINVLSPLLDQRDLESDEIKAIVSDVYLAEHLDDLMKTGELPFYLNKKLMQIQEEKHKKELERIQADKKELEERLQQSERETFKLRKKIELRKQFEKYLAGALVFLIVWAFTYMVILLPTVKEVFSAFTCAIIIALIFGYLLGFQRYEWILEKILKISRSSK